MSTERLVEIFSALPKDVRTDCAKLAAEVSRSSIFILLMLDPVICCFRCASEMVGWGLR